VRKRKHAEHENHERWLVSYADFITLLFAFFVVMFATGQTDKAKAQKVAEAVQAALENGHFTAAIAAVLGGTVNDKGVGNAQRNGPGGGQKTVKAETLPPAVPIAELTPSMDRLKEELKEEIAQGKLQLDLQARGLVVSLREAAFFPSGQDRVLPASFQTLVKLAEAVRTLPNHLRFEGHTDSIPINNERFHSNWELSAARSIAMLELFRHQYQIPQDRMSIAGYAETTPIASNDSEQGRAKNRRVDLVVLNMKVLSSEPPKAQPQGKTAH
jgi:chemotaxis protein MotB